MDDSQVTDTVLATYRQIAEHFQLLSGPDAGRKKATRAGWPVEPQNHPLDPVHVRVPREVWDAGPDRPRQPADKPRHLSDNRQPVTPDKSRTDSVLDSEATALREALARERDQADQAEARGVVLEAERAAAQAEVADLRERVGRSDGTATAERAARERVEVERDATREELATWTAGGPLSRALRALIYRRS